MLKKILASFLIIAAIFAVLAIWATYYSTKTLATVAPTPTPYLFTSYISPIPTAKAIPIIINPNNYPCRAGTVSAKSDPNGTVWDLTVGVILPHKGAFNLSGNNVVVFVDPGPYYIGLYLLNPNRLANVSLHMITDTIGYAYQAYYVQNNKIYVEPLFEVKDVYPKPANLPPYSGWYGGLIKQYTNPPVSTVNRVPSC